MAVERSRFRAGEQDSGHAVLAGDEGPAFKHTAVVGPVDDGFGLLKIHRACIVTDFSLRLTTYGKIKGRNKEIRVHETLLFRVLELEFLRLLVFACGDQFAQFRQVG